MVPQPVTTPSPGITVRSEDGKVLAEHIGLPAVDGAPASDHAVAGDHRLVHVEVRRPVGDEHVVFLETAGIEQHLEALARRELALLVLRRNALRAPALAGLLALFFQRRNDVLQPLPRPAGK